MNTVTQESQSDVHNFYQTSNPAMPASRKRARSSSKPRSKSATKLAIKTNQQKQIWPYRSNGMGPMWDPFPAQAQAIMRYSQVVSLNPSAGLTAPYLFRANSIFDPDYTGIGHQPYGHDTYASIYNHYSVAKATITMSPASSANSIYGISLTDDTTVQADYDTIRETKGTKMGICNQSVAPTVVQVYSDKQNFSKTVSQPTSALFGASPAEVMYFHIWSEGTSSTVEGNNVDYLITISYIVNMWELKDLGQS